MNHYLKCKGAWVQPYRWVVVRVALLKRFQLQRPWSSFGPAEGIVDILSKWWDLLSIATAGTRIYLATDLQHKSYTDRH